jgi:phosphopantothenoylcysteine decarboxylase/phosphopantothenate--cysteine ligase
MRILLGVTGSIACYKSADLASKLRQAGAEVDVILTAAACQFVTPLTFQSVTGRHAYTDQDLWGDAGHVLHIGLAEQADLLVIAPITANTIAKLVHGSANNLLSIAALAARCPTLIAPAMDGGMFEHPATQENLKTLLDRGVQVAGPATGHLASGLKGIGRMLEPADLLGRIRQLLASQGPLSGQHIVVTAGGTQEPIDPVRFITNRSSGKQGFALAQAALDLGAKVTLITAPNALPTPSGAERIDIQTAEDMLQAVTTRLEHANLLIMAAAVADFRPAEPAAHKLKKRDGLPQVQLKPAPDILKAVAQLKAAGRYRGLTFGFAAESQDLVENAREKLTNKQLDLIVANDISAADAGFSGSTNRVTFLYPDGLQKALPLLDKYEVAEKVLLEAVEMMQSDA